jgi:hypothetical protein
MGLQPALAAGIRLIPKTIRITWDASLNRNPALALNPQFYGPSRPKLGAKTLPPPQPLAGRCRDLRESDDARHNR